jgi:hypothetical protein
MRQFDRDNHIYIADTPLVAGIDTQGPLYFVPFMVNVPVAPAPISSPPSSPSFLQPPKKATAIKSSRLFKINSVLKFS